MTLSNISFEDLSERNLLEQIRAGVPEGVLVDYKRDMYGGRSLFGATAPKSPALLEMSVFLKVSTACSAGSS
jgi:hypothetical protein